MQISMRNINRRGCLELSLKSLSSPRNMLDYSHPLMAECNKT